MDVRLARADGSGCRWLTLPCDDDEQLERAAMDLGVKKPERGTLRISACHPPRFEALTALRSDFALRELNLLAYVMDHMKRESLAAFLSYAPLLSGSIGAMINTAYHIRSGEQPVLTRVESERYLAKRYIEAIAEGDLSYVYVRGHPDGPVAALLREGHLLEGGFFVFHSHADAPYNGEGDLDRLLREQRGQYDLPATYEFLFSPVAAYMEDEPPIRTEWNELCEPMLPGLNEQLENRGLDDLMAWYEGYAQSESDGYRYLRKKVAQAKPILMDIDGQAVCATRLTLAAPLTPDERDALRRYLTHAYKCGDFASKVERSPFLLIGPHYLGDRRMRLFFCPENGGPADPFFLREQTAMEAAVLHPIDGLEDYLPERATGMDMSQV